MNSLLHSIWKVPSHWQSYLQNWCYSCLSHGSMLCKQPSWVSFSLTGECQVQWQTISIWQLSHHSKFIVNLSKNIHLSQKKDSEIRLWICVTVAELGEFHFVLHKTFFSVLSHGSTSQNKRMPKFGRYLDHLVPRLAQADAIVVP